MDTPQSSAAPAPSRPEPSWSKLLRASVCAAVLLTTLAPVVLTSAVISASPAVAGDDDDDDEDIPFDQKLIRNLMSGLGAIDPNKSSGIDYRERSPLVVPPKIDLPPPQTSQKDGPNWPKDPDVAARKAMREANKQRYQSIDEQIRPLSPSEMNAAGRAKVRASTAKEQPGQPDFRPLTPSQLGGKSLFSTLFEKNKDESKQFTGEPPRESLTEPPAGYQTPSPSYAYGITSDAKAEVSKSNIPSDPPSTR